MQQVLLCYFLVSYVGVIKKELYVACGHFILKLITVAVFGSVVIGDLPAHGNSLGVELP